MTDIVKIQKKFERDVCVAEAHYVENPETHVSVFIPAQYERRTQYEDRYTVIDSITAETHEFLTPEAAQEFLRSADK